MRTPSTSPDQSPHRFRGFRVWAGLAILLAALVAAFVVMTRKESELESAADATRVLRMSRQAMMEVDVAVLDMIARREQADLTRYARAANKLARYDAAGFPATVSLDGREVPAWPVIASLKANWALIVAAVQDRQPERARSVYVEQDVSRVMSAFVESAIAEIEKKDVVLADLQRDIRFAIGGALVLVFLIGFLAYRVASQRALQDRRELQSAMLAANASREAATVATQEANASREKVSRLFEMTEMLQSASDHADANAVLRATAAELIPGFGGALYVFNNSRDRLALSTTWGREGGAELPETIGLQQCWSLKRGKPHINVPGSRRLCCEHHVGEDSTLEIPMIARGEILGLLQIFASGEKGEARLAEVASLGSALADGMSLALANIALRDKLRSQALRDPLTGLYNRRYMEDALQRVVRLAERERTEVSVIMIDLDHFKRLNDNHGHAKGDAVLRDAAAVLLNQLRETDVACRYGGEELLVVLPNCSLDMAASKAERMRAAIEALSEPNGARVSASMGVAAIPSTSRGVKDLLAMADASLYEAKQAGRNRVVASPRLGEAPASGSRLEPELLAAE